MLSGLVVFRFARRPSKMTLFMAPGPGNDAAVGMQIVSAQANAGKVSAGSFWVAAVAMCKFASTWNCARWDRFLHRSGWRRRAAELLGWEGRISGGVSAPPHGAAGIERDLGASAAGDGRQPHGRGAINGGGGGSRD